jgi:hypothetical protein
LTFDDDARLLFELDSAPMNVNLIGRGASHRSLSTIGPLIAPQRDQHHEVLEYFRGILNEALDAARFGLLATFASPITLLTGDILDQFAVAVSDYTKGQEKPRVIEPKEKSAAGATGDGARDPRPLHATSAHHVPAAMRRWNFPKRLAIRPIRNSTQRDDANPAAR